MKIKAVLYNDGITVEDELGNKLFVKNTMFPEDYRQQGNCIAWGIGEIALDRWPDSPVGYTQEIVNENKLKD